MKLIDAITNVDKSKENKCCADIDDFTSALGLDYCYDHLFCDEVEAYHITKWICTDTWVGLTAYFYQDKPVAVSFQPARKSDTTVLFVSNEAAETMRTYILSLMDEKEKYSPSIIGIDEEIDDFYTVDYGEQLLVDQGYYKDQLATVIKTYPGYDQIDLWHNIDIRIVETGEELQIDLVDFKIPLHVIK